MQCQGTTKKGSQCKFTALRNDQYCIVHTDQPLKVRCEGKNKNGSQCWHKPMLGTKFCYTHSDPIIIDNS